MFRTPTEQDRIAEEREQRMAQRRDDEWQWFLWRRLQQTPDQRTPR